MAKCQQAPAICYGSSTEVKCTVGQCCGGHFCCVMAQSLFAALGVLVHGLVVDEG